ncbi:MAG: 1-deoxy-D-xylulose-5-phosphate synthase [Desulfarculaceae bacterium]|nr:1-deoxy-D-xylulose-5-phosphate synthase [Desulfarculaceae bacterium]MCF8071771.1 1-deoxy-D-xylulose-5-phosphate synthase [Desulfarculaceae bacterium]MCF8101321.1 1-deoxy-D-xylulose-5-phosphate synthase [Desulfarculaceae bacterium]MCF8117280.1 1-deoxy-D-xylulose-5-phosphate synthase [Desulfarculaceae bacterium]
MTVSAVPIKTKALLEGVNSPADLKDLNLRELEALAQELRQAIISTVEKTGGHLAPSLGVVELTLALHYVFDLPQDKIVWDVGHQTYAHKLLTGRRGSFDTLRKLGGLSGFPKRAESPYDSFDTGHSSTSISAALGMAVGERLKDGGGRVVAVIGDGSLTAGLAYEGLNQAGGMDEDLIVVLNDNGMSIAPNVGALSKFMSRTLSGRAYQTFRKELERMLGALPGIGKDLLDIARRSEESFKTFYTPGMLFEAFKFNYVGPIDGHNIERLIETLKNVKPLHGPQLVHVITKKGKGHAPAEANPAHYHGVGAKAPAAKNDAPAPPASYTEVFGQAMVELAEDRPDMVAITAAMPEGTGLLPFAQAHPERFMDVGIAEQHAVTFAGGLAVQGFHPVVAIYSTFMQRAYDQVVHDVCLMNLPVIFAMDRGGIVGEDGATHQGLLDLSFLRCVPNLGIMSPADEDELRHMLLTALERQGPVALRYPRGKGRGVPHQGPIKALPWGKGELTRQGRDLAIVAIGVGVGAAEEAAEQLALEGIEATVMNARFVKPLDAELICELAATHGKVVTVEENEAAGGFGSAVLELLARRGMAGVRVKVVALKDTFVEHGTQTELRSLYEVDCKAVAAAARELLD